MSVTYDIVDIRTSELHTHRVVVPAWETLVLQAVYGEDAQVVGHKVVNRKLPDPNDEFVRLANRYGPKNEEVPYVAGVYGSFGPGVSALRREIASSKTSVRPAPVVYRSPSEREDEAQRETEAAYAEPAVEAKPDLATKAEPDLATKAEPDLATEAEPDLATEAEPEFDSLVS